MSPWSQPKGRAFSVSTRESPSTAGRFRGSANRYPHTRARPDGSKLFCKLASAACRRSFEGRRNTQFTRSSAASCAVSLYSTAGNSAGPRMRGSCGTWAWATQQSVAVVGCSRSDYANLAKSILAPRASWTCNNGPAAVQQRSSIAYRVI